MIIAGSIPLTAFAASYYWFPLVTGRTYDRRLARVQALVTVVGVVVAFVPLFLVGLDGLPRRSASYPATFAPLQRVSTVGAYPVGVVLWLYNVVQSLGAGPVVTDADVWSLKGTGQSTREWQWFEERLDERRKRPGRVAALP
ncbi:MAG: cbb3-type cytochrome c oxidase subunit I [Haloferacaceae archaeon]